MDRSPPPLLLPRTKGDDAPDPPSPRPAPSTTRKDETRCCSALPAAPTTNGAGDVRFAGLALLGDVPLVPGGVDPDIVPVLAFAPMAREVDRMVSGIVLAACAPVAELRTPTSSSDIRPERTAAQILVSEARLTSIRPSALSALAPRREDASVEESAARAAPDATPLSF